MEHCDAESERDSKVRTGVREVMFHWSQVRDRDRAIHNREEPRVRASARWRVTSNQPRAPATEQRSSGKYGLQQAEQRG